MAILPTQSGDILLEYRSLRDDVKYGEPFGTQCRVAEAATIQRLDHSETTSVSRSTYKRYVLADIACKQEMSANINDIDPAAAHDCKNAVGNEM
jgi:hypothetical protein